MSVDEIELRKASVDEILKEEKVGGKRSILLTYYVEGFVVPLPAVGNCKVDLKYPYFYTWHIAIHWD